MKKLMYIAAALLVLVGCNNKENVKENAPQNLVTITGGIDFSAQDGPNKVIAKPGWENVADEGTVEFMWEEGDEIAVLSTDFSECHKFTVSKIFDDGATAEFTGEPLSGGMEHYVVCYPYEYGKNFLTEDWFKHQQYTGNFKPVGSGDGSNDYFKINFFPPVFDLSLKGEVTLGKIELYVASSAGSYETECSAAISMGESGLQLTNEPQHVTLSTRTCDNEGLKLKFFDTNNQLLMEKEISKKVLVYGQIYSFPELEVTAIPPVEWTKSLSLGKEAAEFIYIETGVVVSGYTEDANHKKLNEEGDLWEVLDNNELFIQTYTNKINSSLEGMFSGYVNVKFFTGLQYIHATTAKGMFMNCSTLNFFDYTDFDTEDVTDMSNMFNGCESLAGIEISSFNTAKVTNMSYMFRNCYALVDLDLSSFDTKNVTDMSSMFSACQSLQTLNLSSFNTEKVTDMSGMFYNCLILEALTLSDNFKVAREKKSRMFDNCATMSDGCTVSGVTNADIKTALKTDTGWVEDKMHFCD